MTPRIRIEPGKRSGQPCIRGLRITVLFDENLSRKLVVRLAELYPESAHVVDLEPRYAA